MWYKISISELTSAHRKMSSQLCMTDSFGSVLRSLNLPSSLEALEKSIGLPPSLLKKAEEVRLEDGPRRIAGAIQDVQSLAQQNVALLDQVSHFFF